ncbi:LPXTG cell wall anchor domain-containing protein [Streptococcus pluranimalium]|uniref:LPXTG cell wall anchor domain-containing protein n=1 Tax=Streptococcus pluranimalium TaxID=82348 RepID=UPI0039FC4B8B
MKEGSVKTNQTVLPAASKPSGRDLSPQLVKKSTLSQIKSGENLPKTGERNNQSTTIYGGIAMVLVALFTSRKRKRDSES